MPRHALWPISLRGAAPIAEGGADGQMDYNDFIAFIDVSVPEC